MLQILYSPLRKIDNWLRVAYPWIWATKIHEHLYLGLILIFLCGLIGSLFSFDTANLLSKNGIEMLFAWMFIPAVALLGFFFYRMALFNSQKRHGRYVFYQEFIELLIYIITVLIPLLLPYSIATVMNFQIAGLLTDDEISDYKRQLEIGSFFFPRNASDYDYFESPEQYSIFVSSLSKPNSQWRKEEQEAHSFKDYYSNDRRDDVFNHEKKYRERRPRLYFSLNYDRYRLCKYGIGQGYYYGEVKQKEYADFGDEVIAFNQSGDLTKAKEYINKTCDILATFSRQEHLDPDKILNDFVNHRYSNSHAYHFITEIYTAEKNLGNIQRAKQWNYDSFDLGVIWAFLLAVFCIAVLFFMFKNIHWKHLLLGLLTGAVLLTAVIIVMVSLNGSEKLFISVVFVLSMLFIVLSVILLNAKTFSLWHGIVAVCANIILPFSIAICIIFFDKFDVIDYRSVYNAINILFDDTPDKGDTILLGLVYGIALYITVGNSYMKYLYRKLVYLPKHR